MKHGLKNQPPKFQLGAAEIEQKADFETRDLHPPFQFGADPEAKQLYLKRALIDAFQKPETELAMNCKGSADNLFSELAMQKVNRMFLCF